jgi:NNP family nitrate/nitrite transporter-like MFS transporter
MSGISIKLLDLSDKKIKTLHFTWFAFFISFMIWFSHAPLIVAIQNTFGLSEQEVKALLIMNVALTIPARIIVGMMVDKYGPRIMFSTLLVISSILCFFFAFAQTYEQLALARFLLGFSGAGFVIGIRLIGEWFPAKQVGLAEGIYGGWGNFGSAASAMLLPSLALIFGGEEGWRYAIASTGVISLVYAVIFYLNARNTPRGSTYFSPKKMGAMEVTSKKDFFLYLLMNIPMYLALGTLTWKVSPENLGLLGSTASTTIYISLVAVYIFQTWNIWKINGHVFHTDVDPIQKYEFKQVAILNLSYFVTFGSELAVVSMLPFFFMNTFDLSAIEAGLLASGFAFMNIVARPAGGYFSDKFGRKKSLTLLIAGLGLGYFLLSQITSEWSLFLAVIATIFCAFFVQAGEGAVFAIVPLVKRRMTGQIAGMTGAYGNIGGVTFLTIYSFVDASTFFAIIAASSILVLLVVQFIEEPKGHITEVMPDGTLQIIDVE